MKQEYHNLEIIAHLFIIISVLSFLVYKVAYAIGIYNAIQ